MKKIHVTSHLLENIEESKKEFNTGRHFIFNYIMGILISACYFFFAPITLITINVILIETLIAASIFSYIESEDAKKRKANAKKELDKFALSLRKENIYINEPALTMSIILVKPSLNNKEKAKYVCFIDKSSQLIVLKEVTSFKGNKMLDYSVQLLDNNDAKELNDIPKKLVKERRKYRR